MGLQDRLFALPSYRYDLPILFDEYKGSTTAWVTNALAGAFWISSGLFGPPGLAMGALLLHIIPPIPYYYIYGPFGIEFDFTPTRVENGKRVPDKRAEQENEAVLTNGHVSIHSRVKLSKRLNGFSIQFSAPSDLLVQLRDVPMMTHTYDRDENILRASDVSSHEFNLVLEVYGDHSNPGEDYSLEIIDYLNDRPIEVIDIINR